MTQLLNRNNTIKGKIINDTQAIRGAISDVATDASTTKKGIIRIATEEEAIEGTSTNTAITPHTLRLTVNYVHEQGEASNIWIIKHNLNKIPSVVVLDTSGEEQIPNRKIYNSKNQVTLYFLSEFSGTAILN